MSRIEELLDVEDAKWHEFQALIVGLEPARFDEPVDDDGWTLKDVMWHLSCWTAEAARELQRINMGTYTEREYDTDQMNATWMEEGRRHDLDTVKASWASARTMARHEWSSLEVVTPEAEEWFYEIGPEHFDEHLPKVRAWLERSA